MKLRVDKFSGLRPLMDSRAPIVGAASIASNCYLRRNALTPMPLSQVTGMTVPVGSKRLSVDTRRNTVRGGSATFGIATETFPDSELLYVFDSDTQHVKDASGTICPIRPTAPIERIQDLESQWLHISDIGAVNPATTTQDDFGNNFAAQIPVAENNPPDGDGLLDEELFKTAASLKAQANIQWVDANVLYAIIRAALLYGKQRFHYMTYNSSENKYWMSPGDRGNSGVFRERTLAVHMGMSGYVGMFKTGNSKATFKTWSITPSSLGDWFTPDNWADLPQSITNGYYCDVWYNSVMRVINQGSAGLQTEAEANATATQHTLYGDWLTPAGLTVDAPVTSHSYSVPNGTLAFPKVLIDDCIQRMEQYFYYAYARGFTATTGGYPDTPDLWNFFWSTAYSYTKGTVTIHSVTPFTDLAPFTVGTTKLHDSTPQWKRVVPKAYCYTWVDAFGRESKPSLPKVYDVATAANGLTRTHSISVYEQPPADAVTMYVYRAVGNINRGDLTKTDARWLRCMTVDMVHQASLIGMIAPDIEDAAGFELETHEFYDIPTDAAFVRETESGHLVYAAIDNTQVQYSYRHIWYATHPSRTVQLPRGWVVMGIEVVGDSVYVITNKKPMLLLHSEDKGSDGLRIDVATMQIAPEGCISSGSVCNTQWGVAYSSPVGLVLMHGNNVVLPLATVYDPQRWSSVGDIVASAYWDGMYVGFNSSGGVVIDLPDPLYAEGRTPAITTLSFTATAATVTDGYLFYLPPNSGTLRRLYMGDAKMSMVYKTLDITNPHAVYYSSMYIDGTGGAISVELEVDGRMVMQRDVECNKLVRIPRHKAGFKVALKVTTTATINAITIATTGHETAGS